MKGDFHVRFCERLKLQCSGLLNRISIWLFVVNFNVIFPIGKRFRAGRYKISHLQQYLSVVRHPIEHPTHIQASMTLPTRPNAPSQAHLQGTQSQHTKANLAKEPALSYTRQPSCGATHTHILDDHGERVCVQHSIAAIGG